MATFLGGILCQIIADLCCKKKKIFNEILN